MAVYKVVIVLWAICTLAQKIMCIQINYIMCVQNACMHEIYEQIYLNFIVIKYMLHGYSYMFAMCIVTNNRMYIHMHAYVCVCVFVNIRISCAWFFQNWQ